MKNIFLLNAFSLQMVSAANYGVKVTTVGQLPEGATTLPEDFKFKYLRVEITPA
jgi:hypothetical protein